MVLFQLKKLYYLDLSNNLILTLFLDYNVLITDLEIVSIKNNRLSTISSRFFDDLNTNIIVTDDYCICCKTPSKSLCTSVKHWFQSCKHLLLQRSITMCAFISSFLLIVFNVFARFLERKTSKKKYSVFQYVSISVNFTDLTWGIYLIFLVISDFVFEDNFVLQESLWKSSFFCFFLFSINLNFNILSPLLSIFMTLSRMMVVLYPLNSNFKNGNFVLKCCILMYVLATTLVTGFVVIFKHMHDSVPFRLCSPFIDPTHSNIMLQIITYVVVCQQFVMYFLNILFNRKIILELKNSIGQKDNVTPLILQFSVSTASNTLCWIPSGIIFLICMLIDEFSITLIT